MFSVMFDIKKLLHLLFTLCMLILRTLSSSVILLLLNFKTSKAEDIQITVMIR